MRHSLYRSCSLPQSVTQQEYFVLSYDLLRLVASYLSPFDIACLCAVNKAHRNMLSSRYGAACSLIVGLVSCNDTSSVSLSLSQCLDVTETLFQSYLYLIELIKEGFVHPSKEGIGRFLLEGVGRLPSRLVCDFVSKGCVGEPALQLAAIATNLQPSSSYSFSDQCWWVTRMICEGYLQQIEFADCDVLCALRRVLSIVGMPRSQRSVGFLVKRTAERCACVCSTAFADLSLQILRMCLSSRAVMSIRTSS